MDLARIEALLKLLQGQQHVGTLSVEGEGWSLRARRGVHVPTVVLPEDSAAAEAEAARLSVCAGVVGIFRAAKNPPQVGDFVAAGTPLGSIDSMRIPNPVVAEQEGYLLETHVEEGDPVEYGQVLFVLTASLPEAAEAR